jgi:hypothetical protein
VRSDFRRVFHSLAPTPSAESQACRGLPLADEAHEGTWGWTAAHQLSHCYLHTSRPIIPAIAQHCDNNNNNFFSSQRPRSEGTVQAKQKYERTSLDPVTSAWLRAAVVMACGVRTTRGSVEPKRGDVPLPTWYYQVMLRC